MANNEEYEAKLEELDELFNPTINKNHLDDEWVSHPKRVEDINRLLAAAESKRENIKLQLDITAAILDKEARNSLVKVTEGAVSNYIQMKPAYQDLQKQHIQANYEYKIILAKANAFNHRKPALEFLSRLWLANYFVEPYNPQADEVIIDKQIQKQNEALSKSIDRRRKKLVNEKET